MCCALTVLIFLGPRAAIIAWWLIDLALDMGRWQAAFGSFIWPVLGFIFLPWTTLAYVFTIQGGIGALDLILLIIAIAADVTSYAGGAYGNRKHVPGYGN
jgi:hypothetical protein